jgi:hypothetical protein
MLVLSARGARVRIGSKTFDMDRAVCYAGSALGPVASNARSQALTLHAGRRGWHP